MGIHFLHCIHGNKCTGTHDVVHNTFATIAQNGGFHVGQKQPHALLSTTFNSSCWRVKIVFTKDTICTLANIVIANPTQIDLFIWSCTSQGFVTSDVFQTKERNYHNQHLIDQFFLLAIKVFECLHK
jgi:hypothetical protein